MSEHKFCQGCGWILSGNVDGYGFYRAKREHYCTVCDPAGEREKRAAKGEAILRAARKEGG